MKKFTVYCDGYEFPGLAEAAAELVNATCPVACEIILTDEGEIRRLNRETRGVDAVTDVLSFPTLDSIYGKRITKKANVCDTDENGNVFIGSVAICEKRAREQAEEYGHDYLRELNYLAVHGICHLLGYDHVTDGDRAVMREAEEKVLGKMGMGRE